MSHFQNVTQAPPDPILSLTEAFKADSNPEKVNLSVGVFVDDSGTTPIQDSVREAEKRGVENAKTKSYLPIMGSPKYAKETQALCFGGQLQNELSGRIVTAHTPGGTGALRVAGDFIVSTLNASTVWLSNPSWANHKGIFSAAGMQCNAYDYFDQESLSLDYGAFIDSIKSIPSGELVVLHACCHNPTGADLDASQWDEVATIASEKGWIPLLDFAYQGFGQDLEADAHGVRAMAKAGLPVMVAQSFSKNFGLYQDRVGALHIVTSSSEEANRVASQVKIAVRTNYSNPPAHGGAIVSTILEEPELTAQWQGEVDSMRNRIKGVRSDFVACLAAEGVSRDFSFLEKQNGMFSFTGLNADQAIALREQFSIYIVNSGRVNVAGLTSQNMNRVSQAFKSLLG